ncbi:MAG TPA: acyltransferase [Dokdonella sp.]|uniref:LpxL/LpxP family acyltransferase n=1 Tax=Dokdonella sp. TaxID=2291710 RepID=UPI0025BB873A|nr:acyltransferase [Dokdonella sp.]MBX3691265.1 acyltransferase [Dokdonella sp.]HNR92719.1 acyltransferase [Dokdonella sp.]
MSAHWNERREGGGRAGLWTILKIGLVCGRRLSRLLLYPITLYFFLRRNGERRAARDYLERMFGRPASAWGVMRLMHAYAATTLDRIYLLTQRAGDFDIHVFGLDELHAQMEHGRGVLLVGAHVGSFEALRVLSLNREDVDVRVVLDTQATPVMTELLHALNPKIAAGVIDASRPGHEVVLALREAMEHRALATLLGDRARPGEATVVVDFLGAPARFPIAPFLIASLLKVPLVFCVGLYRGGARYDLHFETLAERLELPRRAREAELKAIVQHYAQRLEHHVRAHPWNWFNFHDFWNLDAPSADPAGLPADALPERGR